MKTKLTHKFLLKAARDFAKIESVHDEPSLYGVTDGKAVETYLEHKFHGYLKKRFEYVKGNSAKGIDLPELGVDIKVTSIKQPQSSCPYKSARQKIFGLGYALLVFVYKNRTMKSPVPEISIFYTQFSYAQKRPQTFRQPQVS